MSRRAKILIRRKREREGLAKLWVYLQLGGAGTTFDNSFFDNSFGFLRQFKNGSFLDPVFVHVTGRSQN